MQLLKLPQATFVNLIFYRTEVQQIMTEIDLGYRSTDYITTAQKHMDSGNIQECLRVLKSGVQIGAEPKHLLITAHNNALNGMKKLMTIPSAKKNIQPKQNIFTGNINIELLK